MGLFRVACLLENQQDRTRSVRVAGLNKKVDSRGKKLVAAGPLMAAVSTRWSAAR